MGGTGVATISMEEAAFLNPATLAFFQDGDAYVQRDLLQFKNAKGDIVQKPKSTGIVLADGNPTLSGSLSYVNQEEGNFKRSRWGLTTSAPMGAGSAFGASVRRSTERDYTLGATNPKIDYYQATFGITHSLSPATSLGIVAYDAFNSYARATKAIIGVQQIFVDYITVALDFGGNYNADQISDTLLYRGGVQIRVLNDFYLRFGAFKDKSLQEKGNGYGLAWVTPNLSLEFAMKNTTQDADLAINKTESKLRELSFAGSLKF